MSTDMATDPNTSNDVFGLTTCLKRDLSSKIKEIEQGINKLADIPKSQDQIRQSLRKVLCKECRDEAFNIFKSPLKSFSDIGCQAKIRFSEPDSCNNDKHDQEEESNTMEEGSALIIETVESGRETRNMQQDRETLDVSDRTKKGHSEKTTLQEENARLEQEIGELNKKLKQSNENMDQLQTENGRLNELRQTSKKDLRIVQDERDTYHTQLKSMQDEIDTLRNPADGSLGREITQNTAKISAKHSMLVGKSSASGPNAEKEQMEDSETSANASIERDFDMLVDFDNSGDKISPKLPIEYTSDSNITPLYTDSDNIQGKNEERIRMLEQEKERLDSEKNSLQEENATMKQTIEEREMKMTQLKEAMGQLKKENGSVDADRRKDEERYRMLEQEKERLESERNTLQGENATMKQTINEAEAKLKQLKEAMVQLQEEKESLNADLRKTKETLEILEREKEQMDSEKKALQEHYGNHNEELKSLKFEKTNSESQIKRIQEEKQKIQSELDKLHTTRAKIESELTNTQAENRHLISCQTKRDDEIRSLKTEKDQLHTKIQCVQQEKHEIQQQLDEHKEKIKKTNSELLKANGENRKLTEDLALRDREAELYKAEKVQTLAQTEHVQKEQQRKLDEQKEKMEQKDSDLKKTHNEIQNLRDILAVRANEMRSINTEKDKLHAQIVRIQQEKNQIQDKMKQTESTLIKAQNESQKVTDALGSSEERLRTLQKRHDQLKSETKTLQQEKNKVQQTLEEKVKSLTQEKKKAQDAYMCLKAECDKQNEELRRFKQQLEELKKPQKKRVVLGLRSEKSGLGKSLVDMVTKGLTKRLQERLDMSNLNLMVSFSQNPSDVTNGFQIVLCLNMSRVGTNIADSLKGMKVDRDVFVMVLHHTNKENLSALTPTGHRVTGTEVRQLGGILDMAFSSDGGLYECDLNNVAAEKIASILKKCLIF